MNMKKFFACFILLSFFVGGIAFAGPFGLDMGMSLDQVKNKTGKNPELVQDDLYRVDPPNKNDMFESYIVQISPEYGIVWIKAVGKDITTNGYGIQCFENYVCLRNKERRVIYLFWVMKNKGGYFYEFS